MWFSFFLIGLIRLPVVFVKLGNVAFIRSRIWSSRFLIFLGKVIRWRMLFLSTLWVFLLTPGGPPLLLSVLRWLVMTLWVENLSGFPSFVFFGPACLWAVRDFVLCFLFFHVFSCYFFFYLYIPGYCLWVFQHMIACDAFSP